MIYTVYNKVTGVILRSGEAKAAPVLAAHEALLTVGADPRLSRVSIPAKGGIPQIEPQPVLQTEPVAPPDPVEILRAALQAKGLIASADLDAAAGQLKKSKSKG